MATSATDSSSGDEGSPPKIRGDAKPRTSKPRVKLSGAQMPKPMSAIEQAKIEFSAIVETACSFTCEGGSTQRAQLLVADGGVFHPLGFSIDDQLAYYNPLSGMYVFSQFGHWFIANDYREGTPIYAQNPNANEAENPIDSSSPWYFLSSRPDKEFQLVGKPSKTTVVEDPPMRPLQFSKKCGYLKHTEHLEFSGDECSEDSEECHDDEITAKIRYAAYPKKRKKVLKRLRRRKRRRLDAREEEIAVQEARRLYNGI